MDEFDVGALFEIAMDCADRDGMRSDDIDALRTWTDNLVDAQSTLTALATTLNCTPEDVPGRVAALHELAYATLAVAESGLRFRAALWDHEMMAAMSRYDRAYADVFAPRAAGEGSHDGT